MVGLPAVGKTLMALKLTRYLGWKDYNVNWFNLGSYRRKFIGIGLKSDDFFNFESKEMN